MDFPPAGIVFNHIRRKKIGRPPGSPNRKGSKKTGRKPNSTKIVEHMLDAEIVATKLKVLELMDSGQVSNLSQAAEVIGISKMKLYHWKWIDPDWTKQLDQVTQIIADKLEQEIEQAIVPATGKPITMPYVMARFFRLKSIRPEKYRDNFRFEVVDGRLKDLLSDLKKLGQEEPPKQLPKTTVKEVELPFEIKEVEEVQK